MSEIRFTFLLDEKIKFGHETSFFTMKFKKKNLSKELFSSFIFQILEPLRERFMMLSKEKTSLETDLVDLLDCFGGVADAAQSFNTHFLYGIFRFQAFALYGYEVFSEF